MSFFRVQLSVDELGVIFFDVSATGFFQQVIASIHLYTERVQCLYHLGYVGDNCIFSVRKFGKEVALYWGIDGKFYFLRVNNDKLQFTWMFL